VAGERKPRLLPPGQMELGGLSGPSFMTSVGFIPEFSQSGHGLLGRIGFCSEFTFVRPISRTCSACWGDKPNAHANRPKTP